MLVAAGAAGAELARRVTRLNARWTSVTHGVYERYKWVLAYTTVLLHYCTTTRAYIPAGCWRRRGTRAASCARG